MNQIRLSCLFLLALYATNCYAAGPPATCTEIEANACHELANCEGGVCMCSEGLIGTGSGADGCKTIGWTVRQVYNCASAANFAAVTVGAVASTVLVVDDGSNTYAVNHLFADPDDADGAIGLVNLVTTCPCAVKDSDDQCDARKYAYVAATSGAPTNVLPTGLTVDNVAFSSTCTGGTNVAGCWVIDVTYTTGGPNAISTIYFPNVISTDAGSYDETPSPVEADSFLPKNFPVIQPNGRTTKLPAFATDYNLLTLAKAWASGFSATDAEIVSTTAHYNSGTYPGLSKSPGVVSTTVIDPFFFQYSAVIEIEETDMRSKAGIRKGTVGVEYTVDSFVGFALFKPTTGPVVNGVQTFLETLDTMVSQTAIHVEKTNFFSVSTHGTNDYTFLEYVNLRLVMVYDSDTDNSDTSTNDELRTDSSGNFAYVQVTFTLGEQYQPNTGGLIPFDSVRTAKGTFYSDVQASMQHSCLLYNANANTLPSTTLDTAAVEAMLAQDCAPNTVMCAATTDTISDQFVSFNIPLGEQYFDGEATSDLSQNVFVSMVIDAIEQPTTMGNNPNGGDAAEQMKTTLTASIPIVDGGVNIFCDGVTAKTDLKDVVSATLIIGTASSDAELSRLTIFEDIADTEGSAGVVPLITTPSIESGFMTLVIQGEEDYFTNTGTETGYGLEVEDVITVHVMESGGSDKLGEIVTLLGQPPQDNQVTGALDVDGYPLNGAFFFEIDRATNRAHLQPSADLLAICPFNPTRPTSWSCVTRRDIKDRAFPKRVGGHSTAMEMTVVPTVPPTVDIYDDEKDFMATVLGDSDFAVDLAVSYADVIYTEYLALPAASAGRYQRAYWINPSYEWTPTQTGGESIFTLSQGIVMFALVTLNENWVPSTLSPDLPTATSSGARRRALLTASKSEEGSGASSQVYKTSTDGNQVLLAAMGADIKEYATFDLTVGLTAAEACLSDDALIEAMITKFQSSVLVSSVSSASAVTVTQIISKDLGTVVCSGRRLRNLLALSDATVKLTAAVGFMDASNMVLNLETLQKDDESVTVAASNLVPDGLKLDGKSYQDGKVVQDKTPSGNTVKDTVKDSTASATSMSPGVFAAVLVAMSAIVAA